uniref:Zinc finger BED domain-containing protein 4 n=1 Tax=Trichogramma kaykai TaxID=54128 RepID=A0ABD2XR89_9HYME
MTQEWERLPCFVHTLQLCVDDCKEKIPNSNALILKASAVVGHFARSTNSSRLLDDIQTRLSERSEEPLKLIQYCKTRWDSCYDMFARIKKLRVALEGVWCERPNIPRLDSSDYNKIDIYINLFAPVKDATRFMYGEQYSIIGRIIPIIMALKDQLTKGFELAAGMQKLATLKLRNSVYIFLLVKRSFMSVYAQLFR